MEIDIYSEKGTKVVCVNQSKDTANWGSNSNPELLEIGKVYTVDHTEIHSWHTKVYLVELPGYKFNSSHFNAYGDV
jgi:hypothetical protein